MNEAIIYARFSKADQVKGHSIDRQLDYAKEVCASRGLVISPTLIFTEKGKSAFTGANRAIGSLLSNLENEIRLGAHIGRTLVVEHLDRISRQGYEEVLDFLKACSTNGVSVATWDGSRIYPAGQPVPMLEVIEIILKAELAREESEKKSQRVLSSLAAKREAAKHGERKIASRPPSWIKRVPGGHELIEARADIVREAHRLAQMGYGTGQIASTFNETGIAPWRSTSNGWHESYVGRMLTMRTAIGEYSSPRHGTRILDYYPSCITVDCYNRTQAAREKRSHPANKGARGKAQSNIFQKIIRCHECGGTMNMTPSRKIGRAEPRHYSTGTTSMTRTLTAASYLQCWNSLRKVTNAAGERVCHNRRAVRYERLEPAVLNKVMAFAMDNDRFNVTEISQTRIDLAETKRRLSAEREALETLKGNLRLTVSSTLVEMLTDTEAKITDLERERDALLKGMTRERGSVPTRDFIVRIRSLRADMESPVLATRRDARTMVNDALRDVVSDILCDDQANAMVVMAHGLAAFRVNNAGEIDWTHDSSADSRAVAALTTGAFSNNKDTVDTIVSRAKRQSVA